MLAGVEDQAMPGRQIMRIPEGDEGILKNPGITDNTEKDKKRNQKEQDEIKKTAVFLQKNLLRLKQCPN